MVRGGGGGGGVGFGRSALKHRELSASQTLCSDCIRRTLVNTCPSMQPGCYISDKTVARNPGPGPRGMWSAAPQTSVRDEQSGAVRRLSEEAGKPDTAPRLRLNFYIRHSDRLHEIATLCNALGSLAVCAVS